jgi:uncharacterized protein YndB with AHSA1/START domain
MTDAIKVTPTGDRGIVIARAFDIPAARLFEAWTRPDLLQRWLLGPPGWTMTVCDIDVRPGGSYRYQWRNEQGTEIGMGGVYREVAAPSPENPGRLVATERFDPPYDHGEAISTLTFGEAGGRTTVTNAVDYPSRETRDAVLASGMERGIQASYDRLARILVSP